MGVPSRPRLDHVAVTVHDRAATAEFYEPLGFSLIGTIEQPQDPRGFSIGYLKGGDTVLEVFTYESSLSDRAPQPEAPGFGWAELTGETPDGVGTVAAEGGSSLLVDPNGLVFVARTEGLAA